MDCQQPRTIADRLGETALHRGNPTEADRWLAQGERIACELADESMLALVALARGTAARLRHDPEVARLRYAEALDEGRADDAVVGQLRRARGIAEQIGDALIRAIAPRAARTTGGDARR